MIARKRWHTLQEEEREVWSLIWRRHDLGDMLPHVPELEVLLKKRGERDGYNYFEKFKTLCGTWTIQARYSPRTMLMDEAAAILENVRRIKELLK